MIRENIRDVLEQIERAKASSGRQEEKTELIVVSKTQPVDRIMEAYEAGIRDFGENKVQELTDKYEQMPKDIRWHMIGHLQRNKVKYLIGRTALIHSVDSFRLAQEIHRESLKAGLVTDILIEVNVSGEESKFGVPPEEAAALVEEAAALSHVRVRGLMTIAPYVSDPEKTREYFRLLKKLSVDIIQKNIDNVSMEILSMGMTNDYIVAVEEGSTHVRVGTGIFGMRSLDASFQ